MDLSFLPKSCAPDRAVAFNSLHQKTHPFSADDEKFAEGVINYLGTPFIIVFSMCFLLCYIHNERETDRSYTFCVLCMPYLLHVGVGVIVCGLTCCSCLCTFTLRENTKEIDKH